MVDILNPPPAERYEPVVTFLDITSVLRRHGRWILAVTLLSAVLVGAALLQVPKRYLGEVTLMLDLRRPAVANLQGSAAQAQPSTVDPAVLRSEVKLLQSEPVAREVIRALRLDEVPEFRRPALLPSLAERSIAFAESLGLPARATVHWLRRELGAKDDDSTRPPQADGAPPSLIRAYEERLTVSNDGRSHLIEVSFLSEDPALAARIANAHVEAYIRWQAETKRDLGRTASIWLNDELETLRARVQAAEEAVQRFREAEQIYSTAAATSSQAAPYLRGDTVLAQRLAELNSQLTLATMDRNAREARLEQARALVARREADRITEVGSSPLIQRLREQEATVGRREAELRSRLGPRHPELLTVQAELRDLQNAIGAEIQRVLEGLSNDVRVARAREANLRAEIAALEQRSAQTARAEITLRELEREATVSRALHENLLTQRQVIGIQQGIQQSDVRVVSYATVPTRPSSPKVVQGALIAAGAVGLLLVAFAFAREFMFRGIKGVADLEQAIGLPCLGTVPLLPRRVMQSGRPADAMGKPRSLFADSVRSVRATVSLPKTLLITSALPGEGKSTLSVALGRSLAIAGYSVLLVDADLRHSSVAAALGDESRDGWLNDVLDVEEEAGTAWPSIWPVRVEQWSGLHYLASRSGDGRAPQDLLASSAMHGVLERAAREYDVVLVDSPPILAVADALIMASQAEATLLVTWWRHTPKDAVALAVSKVTRAGGHLIGAVLNQVDMKRGSFAPNDPEIYRHYAMAGYHDTFQTPSRRSPRLPSRKAHSDEREGEHRA